MRMDVFATVLQGFVNIVFDEQGTPPADTTVGHQEGRARNINNNDSATPPMNHTYSYSNQSIAQEIEHSGAIIPIIPSQLQNFVLPYLLQEGKTTCTLSNQDIDLDQVDHAVKPIFTMIDKHLAHLDETIPQWKTIILRCMIRKRIAEGSQQGIPEEQLHSLLQNPRLMKQIIEAGEPRKANYKRALDIYYSILGCSSEAKDGVSSNNILHRLALAVALEHADPIHIFDTKTPIDPIIRYLHYEEAYLNGQLDPIFPTLSTWELRMVVNNDASEDEIHWSRQMIRNYRPDLILDTNYHWKYCKIVKSDVRYKVPDWEQFPKTYKQLLSGGGKCGPRAWFGRMICRSFGIPVWGVRQPGHAAMSHWTPSLHWVVCLGGPNWKKSHWEGRNGQFFDWESRARSCHGSYEKVVWLQCFSYLCNEKPNETMDVAGFEKNIWTQLKWMKCRQIAINGGDLSSYEMNKPNNDPMNKAPTLIEQVASVRARKKGICYQSNGNMTFHASDTQNRMNQGNKVITMKSFHGLMDGYGDDQVHLKEDGRLEYCIMIPRELNAGRKIRFLFCCRVVTVHKSISPLLLQIGHESNKTQYTIPTPYSAGEWMTTEPIEVKLVEGEKNILHIFREDTTSLGISIKDFTLSRIL